MHRATLTMDFRGRGGPILPIDMPATTHPENRRRRVPAAAGLPVSLLGTLLLVRSARAQDLAYCDFSVGAPTANLQLNGSASVVSSPPRWSQGIRITPEVNTQRGTAFHKVPFSFAPGSSLY